MKTNRISLTVAAVAMLAGAAPTVADQDGAVAMRDAAATRPLTSEKAEQLRRDAEALFSQPKEWKKAARLLEESAALRSANDAEGYECLVYAGRIRAAIGDMNGARVALEQAAAHALARGAIVEAAQAYIDAAHAAIALKDARGARELVDRAALLAQSPLLSAQQRALLNGRLAVV